jgi:hypothetical protein
MVYGEAQRRRNGISSEEERGLNEEESWVVRNDEMLRNFLLQHVGDLLVDEW